MDERGIQYMAHRLLRLYGDGALQRVLDCIDQSLASDNDHNFQLWARVFDVIDRHEREQSDATRH